MNSHDHKALFLRRFLLPVADISSKQRVTKYYNKFRSAQWWSRDHIEGYQASRLRRLVEVARRDVPLYRELYDLAEVDCEKIRERSDLRNLPPVSKAELRGAYPDRCVRKMAGPVHEIFTSGSSGQPFAVKLDSGTMSEARALMLLRAEFSGWQPGIPFLQTGMSLDRGIVKRVKDILLGVTYVSAFDLSDQALDRSLELLARRKLKYLMGYPGSLYFLARRARLLGFSVPLHGVVTWGDNLYAHYRTEIERAFGCRVTDTYGCSEGLQVAAQCGLAYGRYHIFMPHIIVEVVDDRDQPLPAGRPGHILLTRLTAGAMPLIRYRVGDIGRLSDISGCTCGRNWDFLEAIEGRDTDVVLTPGGNRLIVHFFTGIFEYYPTIETFRVIQEELGSIRVEIVPGKGFSHEHWEKIKSEILEKGDPELCVEMELVDDIPVPGSNKRRFVVSKLNA